jgi:DNA-binding Lrp family transcriptional regulator
MEIVYLLVEVDVGRLDEVVRRLRAIPGVAEVQAVTGPFDLIAKVEAPHINAALDTVVHKIRRVPGIKSTETLVTVAAG